MFFPTKFPQSQQEGNWLLRILYLGFFLLLGLSFILEAWGEEKQTLNSKALVIGVEQYKYLVPPKPSPIENAEAVFTLLKKKLGFQAELLKNPDHETILDSLIKLANDVKVEDQVLIYFSGYAINSSTEQSSGQLLPSNGDPGDAIATGIDTGLIIDYLLALPARQVLLLLDSCISGIGLGQISQKKDFPIKKNNQTGKGTGEASRIVLTAGAKNQYCADSSKSDDGRERYKHSKLTLYFLKAFNEQPQYIDTNKNESMTSSELYDYLKEKSFLERRIRGEKGFQPELIHLSPDPGEFVFNFFNLLPPSKDRKNISEPKRLIEQLRNVPIVGF